MSKAVAQTAAEKAKKYGPKPTPAQARRIRKIAKKEKGREE